MAPQAKFIQNGDAVDYTPASAVSAGAVVALGNGTIGIASTDIAASKLGSLIVSGVVEFPLAESESEVTVDDDLYWDANGNPEGGVALSGAATATSTGNTYIGKATQRPNAAASAAAAASGAATVFIRMIQTGPAASGS